MSQQQAALLVVFGRPGAGKTTVTNSALATLRRRAHVVAKSISMDLDVCIPDWMKDNFARGIYPSLEQRREFAITMCNHVDDILRAELRTDSNSTEKTSPAVVVLISFSFVNTDLREIFRSRFPQATWVLIDTTEEEAQRRIDARQGHFYKGQRSSASQEKSPAPGPQENSEWVFASVTIPHILLNGDDSVEENAEKILATALHELGRLG